MKYLVLFLFFLSSCKVYYYYDSKGCEHTTHDKSREKEVTRIQTEYGLYKYYDYLYVLRGGKFQTRGNTFDTTNWKQMRVDLLKPIYVDRMPCCH